MPNQPVMLTLGTQSCPTTTNAAGRAACVVTISQHPGTVTTGANFGGDSAYDSLSASSPLVINKERTAVAYSGPTAGDYHDTFTAAGLLVDPDDGSPIASKPLDFALGAVDRCSTLTGARRPWLVPDHADAGARTYTMAVTFPGDTDYRPSADATRFTVTKEQSRLTYIGPARIANGQPFTFTAQLQEDDPTPVAGRAVTFRLGSGATAQTCTTPAVTDSAGVAPFLSGPVHDRSLAATQRIGSRADRGRIRGRRLLPCVLGVGVAHPPVPDR